MVKEKLLDTFIRLCDDARLNTSYPLSPSDWAKFRVHGPLPFEEKSLSFYVHIPFCRRLCSFCEYTRTTCPDIRVQKHYIDTLQGDMLSWLDVHQGIELAGFDIGGGTPTTLAEEVFSDFMVLFSRITSHVSVDPKFEPSIEGTFQTLTEEKLRAISGAGIKRLSLGLQAASDKVLRKASRDCLSLDAALEVRELVKKCGIRKLNIDLMYGLNGKTVADGSLDLKWIKALAPEQVTLYEFRPNMLNVRNFADADERFNQYCSLYDGLIELGYFGEFGSNTFSFDKDDIGVSSYLRSRMCDGGAYKGFGISAQSMNSHGISYNKGKGSKHLNGILEAGPFSEEYTYILPREELLAKYIRISAYYGRFSATSASRILGRDFLEIQKTILSFLQEGGYITVTGDQIAITREGFRHYGAVFSMLGSCS